jgi:DNA-binding transcriptional MocR family regulator
MSVWVRLPDALNSNQLLQAAEWSDVYQRDHFYASSPKQSMMRLSFTMAAQAIEDGVKCLGSL